MSKSCCLYGLCVAVLLTMGWNSLTAQTTPVVSGVEYFWDEDLGYGKGIPVTFTPGANVDLSTLEIPVDGIAPGEHVLAVRARTAQGWGPTITQRITIVDPTIHGGDFPVTAVEYFWDDDPGYGQGTPIPFNPAKEVDLSALEIPVDGIVPGEHMLAVRARTAQGWGPTITQRITIVSPSHHSDAELQLEGLEYFWNDDPGYGKGTFVPIDPAKEWTFDDLQIPTLDVHGDAMLFIRAKSLMGWGPTLPYSILVDAEGNYTLNAAAETSLSERNYQSLGDAFADFADRGVGDDVTFTVVGTATEYALDATTADGIAQITTLAENLDNADSSTDEHSITFTAPEGSGNSLVVTTTDEGLPTVVNLFSHIATEHVALTINGTAYDFTATAVRHEELCSGVATRAVGLSTVSTAVRAEWEAQPHTGTTLSGYIDAGTGDLPSMTLVNSGTTFDTLAVAVTLKDLNGRVLTTYNHIYLVHADVALQAFSTMQPATGSSLDPGATLLRWNAIGDAQGYLVTIRQQPIGEEDATPTEQTIETEETSLEWNVESGMQYTWTVTAVGHCSELTSPAQTFTGRLLPDLVVTAITLPEAAEAGNTITISATIRNQGAGATTEGAWTDRLYYTVNSTRFEDAVLWTELRHSGNLDSGGTYTATFDVSVPMEDAGQLRVFVETDADNAALETDDNNRTMSNTAAELHPFYMNTDDLAALRQFYSDFGGTEWNGEPWDVSATIIRNGNWSGVTFDKDGRVTAVNLQGRGLTGTLSAATAPALPLLTTLNLSRNALTGDAAAFVNTGKQPLLTALNLSYNQLSELSDVLPATITALDLTSQFRTYGNNSTFPGIDTMEPKELAVSNDMTVDLPAIALYNHARQTFSAHSQLRVYNRSYQSIGTLSWSTARGAYTFSPNGWKVTAAQGTEVVIVPVTTSGNDYTNALNSAFRGQLKFEAGDANLTGWTDVNDVQRTLNYVLDSNNSSTFGLWAANTYDDDTYEADDETINIQDIVCTVNIVLDNEESEGTSLMRAPLGDAGYTACFFEEDRRVKVEATEEIAAFTLQLRGVGASQVRLLLSSYDWQMQTRNTADGVRLVVFSPTGCVLPTGTTDLLRLSGDGMPVAVQATNAEAEEVAAAVAGSPDRIAGVHTDSDIRVTVSPDRRLVVSAGHAYGATTVSVYTTAGILLGQYHFDALPAGDTFIRLNTAADAVVVRVSNEETGNSNHKITTKP